MSSCQRRGIISWVQCVKKCRIVGRGEQQSRLTSASLSVLVSELAVSFFSSRSFCSWPILRSSISFSAGWTPLCSHSSFPRRRLIFESYHSVRKVWVNVRCDSRKSHLRCVFGKRASSAVMISCLLKSFSSCLSWLSRLLIVSLLLETWAIDSFSFVFSACNHSLRQKNSLRQSISWTSNSYSKPQINQDYTSAGT